MIIAQPLVIAFLYFVAVFGSKSSSNENGNISTNPQTTITSVSVENSLIKSVNELGKRLKVIEGMVESMEKGNTAIPINEVKKQLDEAQAKVSSIVNQFKDSADDEEYEALMMMPSVLNSLYERFEMVRKQRMIEAATMKYEFNQVRSLDEQAADNVHTMEPKIRNSWTINLTQTDDERIIELIENLHVLQAAAQQSRAEMEAFKNGVESLQAMLDEMQCSDNEDKENCLFVARDYLAIFRDFISSNEAETIGEESIRLSLPETDILLDDWASRVKNHLGKIERKLDTLDEALEELKTVTGACSTVHIHVKALTDELELMCDEVVTYLTVNDDPQIRNEFGKLERERQILIEETQKVTGCYEIDEPAPNSKATAHDKTPTKSTSEEVTVSQNFTSTKATVALKSKGTPPKDTSFENSASKEVTVRTIHKQILLLQNLEETLRGDLSNIVDIKPQMLKEIARLYFFITELQLERDVCDDQTVCVALEDSIKIATEAAEYFQRFLKKFEDGRESRVPKSYTKKEVHSLSSRSYAPMKNNVPSRAHSGVYESDSAIPDNKLSMTEQIVKSSVIVADRLAELEDIIRVVGSMLTEAEEDDRTKSPSSLAEIKSILIKAEGFVDAVERELRRFEDRDASGHLSRLEYELSGLTFRFGMLRGRDTSQSRVHTLSYSSSSSSFNTASSSSSSGTIWSESGKSYSRPSSDTTSSYGSMWYDTRKKASSSQSSGLKANTEDQLFQKELEMALRMSMQESFLEEAGIDSSSREVKHRNSEDFYDLPRPSAEAINIMSQFNSFQPSYHHIEYNQTTENIKEDDDDEEEKEKEKS